MTICISPEAGWSELETFLAGTQKGLTVAMYQFIAPHIFDARGAATLTVRSWVAPFSSYSSYRRYLTVERVVGKPCVYHNRRTVHVARRWRSARSQPHWAMSQYWNPYERARKRSTQDYQRCHARSGEVNPEADSKENQRIEREFESITSRIAAIADERRRQDGFVCVGSNAPRDVHRRKYRSTMNWNN
jgi:hypothetical protein